MSSSESEAVARAVRQVLAGDADRYERIYALTDRRLRAFIRSRYGYYGEDFVEEVAIRTHEWALARLADYDPERASFLTWLCWSARNVAHGVVHERYGPRYAPFNANWLEEQAAPGRGPAEKAEHDRRCQVLREELQRLPEDLRRVIELYDFEGRTLRQTAERLRLKRSGVVRRRARALKALKRRMGERDVHIVERDWTPVPRWTPWDSAGGDDDWTATVGAYLPDDPDPQAGRAAKDERVEEDTG